MLVTISPVEQRARRANFDAVAALRTIQPAAERADDRVGATIAGFDRFFTHPLVADARAALAQDATLRIVGDHGRKISFRFRVLRLDESFFQVAPIKSQLLKLAFAPAIAHWTIKRVIRQQKLEHRSLGFFDLFALRGDDHAVSANDRAGSLELRHLLNAHETHATRRLQSQVGVITERGNVELILTTNIDQPRAFGNLKVPAVEGYSDKFCAHEIFTTENTEKTF